MPEFLTELADCWATTTNKSDSQELISCLPGNVSSQLMLMTVMAIWVPGKLWQSSRALTNTHTEQVKTCTTAMGMHLKLEVFKRLPY